MALTQLTKVDGGGISTTSDYRVGIITASKFVGPFDGTGGNFSGVVTATNGVFSGNISAVDGNFSGNVSIAGTLTYEDVTNIDSVGIITAQKDIHVGAGVSVVGIVTAATFKGDGDFVDIDVDGHTNLDNVSVAGVTTFASSIYVADSIIHQGDTDTKIEFATNDIRITAANKLRIHHAANGLNYFNGNNISQATSTHTKLAGSDYVHRFRDEEGDDTLIQFFNTNVKNTVLEWNAFGNTTAAGNLIFRDINTGKTEYARFTGTGGFNIAKDLDVDGHTNLDNVSVAGVTTITKGSSGGATPNTDSVLTLDNSSHNYIQFRSPNNKEQGLLFGDDADNDAGNIIYDHSDNALTFATNGGTNERLRITSTGQITTNVSSTIFADINTSNSAGAYCNFDIGANGANIGYLGSANHLTGGGSNTDLAIRATNNFKLQTGGSTTRLTIADTGQINHSTTSTVNVFATSSSTGAYLHLNYGQSGALTGYIGAGSHLVSGSGVNDFGIRSANNIDISTGGSTRRVRIKSDGKVLITNTLGLGGATSNPGDLLHAQSPSGEGKIVVMGATTGTVAISGLNGASRVLFGDSSTENAGNITYTHSSDTLSFRINGNTRWKFDSSGHFLPDAVGSYNIGSTGAEIGDVFLADSKKVFLGSDQDASIYHDGTHGYLTNTTGNLFITNSGSNYSYIDSNYFRVRNSSGNHMLEVNSAGANQGVRIFHTAGSSGGGTLKTTSSGIDVTGEVAATQDFPVIKPVLDFNFAVEKKLDPRFTFYRRGTASYVDKKGIVRYASSNEPRFDHHPTTGASLGFLVEKQQSNYQPYSVDMDAGADYKNAVTVINDAAISPDGTKNASKIIGSDNQNTSQRLGWSTQTVPNSSYTMWSIWLKSEETSCIIQVYSNTYTFGADHLNVELADGTTGGHNNIDGNFRYNLEKYPNKWWRLSWGGNGQGGAGGMYVAVVPSISSTRGANTGSAHSKVWYAWGVQEEVSTESRIASSYIPTYGSTATRYGDYAQMQDDDFDDFFDRFQGTVINEHSNALQSYGGGGSGWEFQNNQFQTNLITSTGSGYAHASYPGCHASVFGDRGSNGSGNGSGNDYVQAYGPNDADAQNAPANTGNGRYPSNGIPDYTRYYRTWIDAMSYDVTPSENILRVATGGASSFVGGNTQNISLANISKLEIGNGASQLGYSSIYGRIKRWVYYDKVFPLNQLRNLTAQLPNSYL